MLRKFFLAFLYFSFSLEYCHKNCKECEDYSDDDNDMKCTSCIDNFYFKQNTANCLDKRDKPDYYISNNTFYPCWNYGSKEDYIDLHHCYECDPFMNTTGICLSCSSGYILDEDTNECKKCEGSFFIIENYKGCKDAYFKKCHFSITCCNLNNFCENIIPKECQKNETNVETCIISNKNKETISIFWFYDSEKLKYPSFNLDKSGYLLIEFTPNDIYLWEIKKSVSRKIYFFNEEGRGLLNELNDTYEKLIEYPKFFKRENSTSIVLRFNDSDEIRYLLNFENSNNNLEIIDIKTGDIMMENIFDLFWEFYYYNIRNTPIQILELNEENTFLIACYATDIYSGDMQTEEDIYLFFWIVSFNNSKNEKVDFYSLKVIETYSLSYILLDVYSFSLYYFDFDINSRFFFLQTKQGNLFVSYINLHNELCIYDVNEEEVYLIYDSIDSSSFHKFLLIKDEIKFMIYDTGFNTFNIEIYGESFYYGLYYNIEIAYDIEYYIADFIFLSEVKGALVIEEFSNIYIYMLNFFNDYQSYMLNEFILNVFTFGMEYEINSYSFLFKYKDLLGLYFENINSDNGFILFGYYNSTDPKQILNIKKDGLNYNINLIDYLNLQSNVFEYEIKCIIIIEAPNIKSGLYLISNITKNYIQKNDCIDINTKISLYFSYNGTLTKGNYTFKFAGVLQEAKYEKIKNVSDNIFWEIDDEEKDTLKEEFINEYNERRNLNIIGKVSLVQINVLNDIKVFCDKKYDEFALKNENDIYIACGGEVGIFYDIDNANEITQLNLGINYYFDNNKNSYIKCHQRCKTCSREYNDTNMNCDECIDNFFIRDDNCLEISNCSYNYYYDEELNLKCINRSIHCPDFKPYEQKITKECIENCSIDLLNNICIPTNNIISINDTYQKILNNIEYFSIEKKLFYNKKKFTIFGNNVSFIFTTSEIEKKELFNINNFSSIILDEYSEKELNKIYSITDELPFPILKIEILNNDSNLIDLFYEFFDPTISKKLDLNLLSENFIEIVLPYIFKQYKMDLIIKTKNLGYNIFDLNDPFYNDICSVFTFNNSDISLSERKALLDLSDETLCLPGCNYSNFEIKTLRPICLCKIGDKNNITNLTKIKNDEINNSENDVLFNLIKNNIDISKASNIKVVKCVSIIFKINLFENNYGFYIMFFMILFNIVIIFLSPFDKIENLLNKYCNDVLDKMKKIYKNNENENINHKNKENIIVQFNSGNNNLNNINKAKKNIPITPSVILSKDNKKKFDFNRIRIINSKRLKNIGNSNLITSNNSQIEKSNLSFNKGKEHPIELNDTYKKEEQKLIKELKEKENSEFYIYYVIKYIPYEKRKKFLSENEIENLSYKNALEIEDRNKSNYYFSLLKEKNKIISIVLNDKDFNIQSVKLLNFIFDFNLSLTINALFYNDETIYQINQEQGEYSLKYKYTRVIFSTIISVIIGFIVEFFAFTHKSIIKLRNYKDIKVVEEEIPKLVKKLKLKYITYIIIIMCLNILFFYYIIAFCSIYTIIQTHMISDSLISFLLSMSYSLIFSMVSAIIRIFSLKKDNKFRHLLYIISWIISLL